MFSSYLLSILACVFLCSTCLAMPLGDPWLDAVISFDQPAGSSLLGNDPTDALGPNDAANEQGFVSIDIPETLILAFTDNKAIDGPGNDLSVYQWYAGDSNVDIYASNDNVTYVYLGHTAGNVGYDLSNYSGLDYVQYLKFVGLDNGGSWPGFDLDAVEALNSAPVPTPSAFWLFGSGLIGLSGWKKSRG